MDRLEPEMAEPEIPAVVDVPEETEAATAEYTIDELAAHTGVPSRTIRFYQSKGALPKPEIRGRKAVYTDAHVERLELIGTLQDRGLRIRAIRDLVVRIDSGELALDEWLGLQDKLHQPWAEDQPRLYTRAELAELAGRKHVAADLARLGLVKESGDRFLVESPALLGVLLKMEKAGIDLPVAKGAADLARRALAKTASQLGAHCVYYAGKGFGRSSSPADLTEAFDALPEQSRELVDLIFGQEMERTLKELVSSGQVAKLTNRKR